MSYMCGTMTWSATGVRTFTTTFQPIWVRVTVGALAGGAETGLIHGCTGRADGTRQSSNYFYYDPTLQQCNNSSTQLMSHWENVGGTLTEVLAGTFNSFNATSVKFNCTTANTGYQVFVECGT